MSAEWEEKFNNWAKPPSQTEQDRCDNAHSVITNAIEEYDTLGKRSVTLSPQGSYRNRTNVRQDSDVDICILCTDSIFFDLPDGMTAGDFGISTPARYPFSQFKNDVESALVSYLGRKAVTRGNKAFDVHETTYHVDSDAVAAFEFRRYLKDGTYCIGTAFYTDEGKRIVNWPQQHYDRGVAKRESTAKRFKRIVRILKRLRNEMQEARIAAAKDVASFLIESLVYNVPDAYFGCETHYEDVKKVVACAYNATLDDQKCKEWVEVNGMKWLFRPTQPWTHEKANAFLLATWSYVGFK